jgi:hypothetical protein
VNHEVTWAKGRAMTLEQAIEYVLTDQITLRKDP